MTNVAKNGTSTSIPVLSPIRYTVTDSKPIKITIPNMGPGMYPTWVKVRPITPTAKTVHQKSRITPSKNSHDRYFIILEFSTRKTKNTVLCFEKKKKMQCQNSACEKRLSPEKEGFHTCSLCNTPMYCSNACRVAGWADHNCKNVIHVETDATTTTTGNLSFARPYYFEDFLTQEEIDSLPINSPVFDAFSLASYDGNRLVKQWYEAPIVEPMGGLAESKNFAENSIAIYNRGVRLSDKLITRYYVDIYIGNNPVVTIEGDVEKEMIYAGNDDKYVKPLNALLKKITRPTNKNKYVFWPHTGIDKTDIEVDLQFEMRIDLRIGNTNLIDANTPNAYLAGSIKLDRIRDGYWRNMGKNIKSKVEAQLKAKFQERKGKVTSINNLFVGRYGDDDRKNFVVLTFDMSTGSKPKLVDIEFEVTTSSQRNISEPIEEPLEPIGFLNCFKCDPKDTDMVIGLGMALDELLVTMPRDNPNLERLEKSCAIIKQYAHYLEENNGVAPDYVSNEICANIDAVVDVMFIEAKTTANMKQYSLDLNKARDTIENWETKYNQPTGRGVKNKYQKGKMWAQMKLLRSYLNHNMKVAQQKHTPEEYQALIQRIDNLLKKK